MSGLPFVQSLESLQHSRVARLTRNVDRSQVSRRASIALLLSTSLIVTCLAMATPEISMAQEKPPAKVINGIDKGAEATIKGDLDVDWLEKLKAMPNLKSLTIRAPKKNFRASQLIELTNIKSLRVEGLPLGTPLANNIMVNSAKLPNLRDVAFKATGLTSKGLRTIGGTGIDSLSLIDEEMIKDVAFVFIGKMQSLECLELSGTPIDARGLSALRNCPKLKRFVLLNDRSPTKRIPEIAKFKMLEELELSETSCDEIVDLKAAKSLHFLTLRRCGIIPDSANTLEQLAQLKRISLDNTDITGDSAAEVRQRLASRGIELVDITRMIDVPPNGQSPAVNEATELARNIHREWNYPKRHPSLWIKLKSTYANHIPSMKGERLRTIHQLKKALESGSAVEPDTSFVEKTLAWAPGQLFTFKRHFNQQAIVSESHQYGDAELAWTRYCAEEGSVQHYRGNGAQDITNGIGWLPTPLEVSHQTFWWGTNIQENVTSSLVSPKTATYRELPTEQFEGEECRVLESPGRSERLWISIETGRLRGLMTFICQSFYGSFYRQPIVTKVVGHEVSSFDEYRELFKSLTAEQEARLVQAWYEFVYDSSTPWKLYSFSDYRKVSPQAWFPYKVRVAGWSHNEDNRQTYDFYVQTSTASELATDRKDLKSRYAPLLPKEGEKVQDQRFDIPVNYEYRKNRSAEEIMSMVSERIFLQAKSQPQIDQRRKPPNKLADAKVAANPSLKGKVLATEPEDGLVHLSVGKKDGIELQQMLDILRDGKRIGRLRVVLTRDKHCVGKIVRKEDVQRVNVGDRVQF